ncbi:MAG: leucine-rich repeat domain-containing protein [Oscillospiraceae bacterium]|nr:leucine-rich repeat domain-containing protein [Oscillospiraceae bacterium]
MGFEIKGTVLKKYLPENGEKTVTVPEVITKIGEHAFGEFFFEDGELEEVILPESLKIIDNWGFNGSCIRRITIPENVKKIEQGAFKDCKNLESIRFPEKGCSLSWSTLSGCISLKEAILLSDMKAVPQEFMRECEKIESVSIPDSVIGIGKSAFSGCKNLKEFKMPEKLESIYDLAFAGCASFRKIVIPEKVNRIGTRAFYQCSQLEDIEFRCKKFPVLDMPVFITLC